MSEGTSSSPHEPYSTTDRRAEGDATPARLRLLTAITGGVAHDFNNLLTVILASLESAKAMLPDDSPAGADLAAAREASLRGARLIHRLQLATTPRAPCQLHLHDALRDGIELLRRAHDADTPIRLQPDAGTWPTVADPLAIWQIVFDLVGGVRRGMTGGGTILVGTHNERLAATTQTTIGPLGPGDFAVVRVTAVPAADPTPSPPLLPFPPPTDVGGAPGLEIANVARLVRGLGGGVRLDRAVANRTTVDILFPRARP